MADMKSRISSAESNIDTIKSNIAEIFKRLLTNEKKLVRVETTVFDSIEKRMQKVEKNLLIFNESRIAVESHLSTIDDMIAEIKERLSQYTEYNMRWRLTLYGALLSFIANLILTLITILR